MMGPVVLVPITKSCGGDTSPVGLSSCRGPTWILESVEGMYGAAGEVETVGRGLGSGGGGGCGMLEKIGTLMGFCESTANASGYSIGTMATRLSSMACSARDASVVQRARVGRCCPDSNRVSANMVRSPIKDLIDRTHRHQSDTRMFQLYLS